MGSDDPSPQAALHQGKRLIRQGDLNQAIAVLSSLTRTCPDLPEAHGVLGNAYALAGRWRQAADEFARMLQFTPNQPAAHFGLGSSLARLGETGQAIACFRAALNLGYPQAHCNLGVALAKTGQYDPAEAELRQAIAFNPQDATAHGNLAFLLLLRGSWPEGWREYEWRWRWKEFPSPPRNFKQPLWRGEDLHGRTILLHAEQGLGDALQFIRYLPLAAGRGGRIVVECYPPLTRLLRQVPGADAWVDAGQALPPFDVNCPLLSLPLALGLDRAPLPMPEPYLRADADLAESWRLKLAADRPGFRVGLVWGGSPTHTHDQFRSIGLANLLPLLKCPGATFYSLQLGPAAQQINTLPAGIELLDKTSDLADMAETAAHIANLDLVVAVDTAVLHLAGAMGKPAWGFLSAMPEWRWGVSGCDSPWYPSIHLYRQNVAGQWADIVSRAAEDLAGMIARQTAKS